MRLQLQRKALFLLLIVASILVRRARSSDWPQFMRISEHTGDAAEESLKIPLGLTQQVKLDDAVLTSPAIVGDRAFVVDQMGTAYAVDWGAGRILWKSAPDGTSAMGSNTSSPCAAQGRVYYGTTAGTFHILDAATGQTVRTLNLGWPITGSPVFANESIYIQTLGAVLHCLDPEGNERWNWDHYKRYRIPLPKHLQNCHPGGYADAQYGGNDVVASGRRVVTSFGWDQVCLEDSGREPTLAWCNRALVGKDDGVPMNSSIDHGFVFTGFPGVDEAGTLVRVALGDGSFDKTKDRLSRSDAQIFGTPAVRGEVVYSGRHIHGLVASAFGQSKVWGTRYLPITSSPALAQGYCVFTTMRGDLIAVSLNARGNELKDLKPAPFIFQTPHGKPISSSPAISQGHVFFGCDDGYLYVLGGDGKMTPKKEELALHRRRSRVQPATHPYPWPMAYGTPSNENYLNDPDLKPPFRIRWAVRSNAGTEAPFCATADDVVNMTMEGSLICLEQQTGRLRWRRILDPFGHPSMVGVTFADGRLYAQRRWGLVSCLSEETGETIWSVPCGEVQWFSRRGPACINGLVVFGHCLKEKQADGKERRVPLVEARDAKTGEQRWKVEFGTGEVDPRGCVAGENLLVYSIGPDMRGPLGKAGVAKEALAGETVGIEANTGRVLWRRTDELNCGQRATPSARDGRVYIPLHHRLLACLDAKDGREVWRDERSTETLHPVALGPDTCTGRGYGARAWTWNLKDGSLVMVDGKPLDLGTPNHGCGAVLLTSGGLALANGASGLCVKDAATGKLLWNSMGFAPRGCASPVPSNGRIFCNPQINGMFYCFEPAK